MLRIILAAMTGLLLIPLQSNHVHGGWWHAHHHVCYCLSYKPVMGTCLFLAVLALKACYGLQAVMAP